MVKSLFYDDIYLKPNKCIVKSRSDCNTKVKLGNLTFEMPIIAANMTSVVDEETCLFLAKNNWPYIMHRFDTDWYRFCLKTSVNLMPISISVGINEESYVLIESLSVIHAKIEMITIDVANAWSNQCYQMVEFIKSRFPNTFLIVGNIATAEACKEIASWGANALKCGISNGASCITKDKTGFLSPMFSTILECSNATKLPIIADGGIKQPGDVAKALVAGARMVMAGSLFAGYDESAGEVIEIDGRKYKQYYGNASEYNKQEKKHIEGKKILVDYKGPMINLLNDLRESLASSISYAGGNDLTAFRNVKWGLI